MNYNGKQREGEHWRGEGHGEGQWRGAKEPQKDTDRPEQHLLSGRSHSTKPTALLLPLWERRSYSIMKQGALHQGGVVGGSRGVGQ